MPPFHFFACHEGRFCVAGKNTTDSPSTSYFTINACASVSIARIGHDVRGDCQLFRKQPIVLYRSKHETSCPVILEIWH